MIHSIYQHISHACTSPLLAVLLPEYEYESWLSIGFPNTLQFTLGSMRIQRIAHSEYTD